jgi:hypothetical protein
LIKKILTFIFGVLKEISNCIPFGSHGFVNS